jgi:hypothetical protein
MHSFRNIADTPSRMLLINFPGDLHEAFFETIGDPLPSGTTQFPEMKAPDIAAIVQTAAQFGIHIPVPENA